MDVCVAIVQPTMTNGGHGGPGWNGTPRGEPEAVSCVQNPGWGRWPSLPNPAPREQGPGRAYWLGWDRTPCPLQGAELGPTRPRGWVACIWPRMSSDLPRPPGWGGRRDPDHHSSGLQPVGTRLEAVGATWSLGRPGGVGGGSCGAPSLLSLLSSSPPPLSPANMIQGPSELPLLSTSHTDLGTCLSRDQPQCPQS